MPEYGKYPTATHPHGDYEVPAAPLPTAADRPAPEKDLLAPKAAGHPNVPGTLQVPHLGNEHPNHPEKLLNEEKADKTKANAEAKSPLGNAPENMKQK